MENNNEGFSVKFALLGKGMIISMLLTFSMILILSIVLSFTNAKENIIMPMVIFISAFSILVASFFTSKKLEEKGIIYGSLLGIIYMLFLYLISSIMNSDFSLNCNAIIMIVFGIIGGAIGGILGINSK